MNTRFLVWRGLAIALLAAMPAAPAARAASAADYHPAEVADIKLDQGKLEDEKVEITGWMFVFNDHWSVEAKAEDGVSLYVDTQFLPREERKELLLHCAARWCPVVLRGVVNRVDFGEWGITAADVAPRPDAHR